MLQHDTSVLQRWAWAIGSMALAAALLGQSSLAISEPADQSAYPPLLQNQIDAGKIEVVKQFDTGKQGLTGYIVKRGGYQTVIYGADGYLFLGPLFGPDGRNLSKQYVKQYAPKPDVSQAIQSLDSQYIVTEGPNDAPAIYAFIDPNCIFCHRLYQLAKPLIDAGKLQVHWVMVGVLGPSSIGRAAAILTADNPAQAIARNEAGFDVKHEQGGVDPIRPSKALAGILDRHRAAMFKLGSSGTPTIVFSMPDGEMYSRVGVPPDGWLARYTRSNTAG